MQFSCHIQNSEVLLNDLHSRPMGLVSTLYVMHTKKFKIWQEQHQQFQHSTINEN